MAASSRRFLLELLGCMLFLHQACGDEHYYDFVMTDSNFTRLCLTKSMPVVNDSFPGPEIRVHKGDTVYVNFHNLGHYGVTIHWHGVSQPRNPWSDGPEYITQCPIEPGSNFTYTVIFDKEEGTLWWHAHSDWTRDTVHGAIVILPRPGADYPFPKPDAEEVIVLESWYKTDVMGLMIESLAEGGKVNVSDAFAINGQPGDFYPCSKETTYRLTVDYGKTYLLRIVNAALSTDFFFGIAGHNITAVGTDAAYLKPLTDTYIFITPGQTIDVLLTANQRLSHYYMYLVPYFDGGENDYDHSVATAILQYSGDYTPPEDPEKPATFPTSNDGISAMSFVLRLRSLANAEHPIDVPTECTTKMFVVVGMNALPCLYNNCTGFLGEKLAASFNNMTFSNPSVDILHAYYWNISGYYNTTFPDHPPVWYNFTGDDLLTPNVTQSDLSTKVKVLDFNETVEITFQVSATLKGAENHPKHLHGYRFYVVGRGFGIFNNVTDPKNYNLVDPPERNTVFVPKDGWATIRFRAKNPGVWYMHCHFDKHMTWGMSTAFVVKNGGTEESSIIKPPDGMPACKSSILHPRLSLSQPQKIG